MQVSIFNEEDIPHTLLTSMSFPQQHSGITQNIILNFQGVVNDKAVHDISTESRKCIFPDENIDSKYKYYSFSVCVTECLKKLQITKCNCTHPNLIYDGISIILSLIILTRSIYSHLHCGLAVS